MEVNTVVSFIRGSIVVIFGMSKLHVVIPSWLIMHDFLDVIVSLLSCPLECTEWCCFTHSSECLHHFLTFHSSFPHLLPLSLHSHFLFIISFLFWSLSSLLYLSLSLSLTHTHNKWRHRNTASKILHGHCAILGIKTHDACKNLAWDCLSDPFLLSFIVTDIQCMLHTHWRVHCVQRSARKDCWGWTQRHTEEWMKGFSVQHL